MGNWLIGLIGLNSLEAGRRRSWEGERIKEKGVRRKDRSREVVKLGSWDAEGISRCQNDSRIKGGSFMNVKSLSGSTILF